MRFMIIVKATRDSEAGVMPPEHLLAEMAAYHGELAKAVEWTKKFPNPTLEGSDCEIEVRRMFELEDFGESDTLERFRETGMSGAERLS